jgi:RNA polymerase sigma factor (sigma-70 family)
MDADPNRELAQDLLVHKAWMTRLAHRLAVDAAEAGDVLQEAWIVALKNRPRRREALGAWLESVLRNRVRQRARGEAARRGRESRVSRPEATPSTADVVALAEGQRLLVERVLALDEPYRDTVLRRFFLDESAAEIARHLDVPASTVRNRLRRGLDRLRRDLDARTGGDGRNWLASVVLLSGPRVPAPVAASTLTATTGVLVMGQATKLGIAAALILGGIGAVWVLRDPAQPPLEPALGVTRDGLEAGSLAGSSGEEAPTRVALSGTTAPVAEPEQNHAPAPKPPVEPAPPPPPGTIELRVRRGTEPLAGGQVFLATDGENWVARAPWGEPDRARRFQLDAEGTVVIAGLDPGTHPVGVEVTPGDVKQRRIRITEARGQRIEIVLGTTQLSGHIYDPTGRPVEGARVQIGPGGGETMSNSIVWSNGEGYYEAGSLPGGLVFFNVQRGGTQFSQTEEMRKILLPEDGALVVDHGQPEGLATWQGVVRDRAGEVMHGGGRLHVKAVDGTFVQVPIGELEGRFSLSLSPGSYSVKASPPGYYSGRLPLEEALPMDSRDLARDLTLPGTTLRGKLVDGATGEVLDADGLRGLGVSLRQADADWSPHRTAILLPDGSYRLYGVEPGRWQLVSARLPAGVAVEVRAEDLVLHTDLTFDR